MMWSRFLTLFLRRFVNKGSLVVVFAEGHSETFGELGAPAVTVRLHTRSLPRKLLLNADLILGEAYMDGTLTIDGDDIYGLIELLMINIANQPPAWHRQWLAIWQRIARASEQNNPVHRSRENVAYHYDLSTDLYRLFLDKDQQYSCAYFRDPTDDLKTAQENKREHLAAKLLLKPGMRVLDIGCGWGGMGLHLAREYGAHVTGITLSQRQHKIARQRAKSEALEDTAEFLIQDYREVDDQFDRILSVGMLEHVGTNHYPEYFSKIYDNLADDGVAVVHTIGRANGSGLTNPWIAKYIFPGGYIPALTDVLPAIERSGLYVTDIEILRLHYAETLRHWRARFEANRDRIRKIYDERFCRMWRFYLVSSELSFRYAQHVVFQIQLAKKQDAVPLTRDYLAAPTWDYEPNKAAA